MSDLRRAFACAVVAVLVVGAGGGTLVAQPVARGTVLSKRDGTPIVSAEVSSPDGRTRVHTDHEGRFQIGAGPGDSVHVRALGYRDAHIAVGGNDVVVRLDAFATMLQGITTTAGQRAIHLNESTASASVIDRREIDAIAAVGASQALRHVPGLQEIASPPSKTTMSIRGLDAARVLVLVDGEPVTGALIDTRDIGRLSTVATERIEVTKGPSSVEFGSDALGGVINLVTSPPTQSFTGNAVARLGGMGRRESVLDVSDTHGNFGYRVSGGWRQLDRVVAVNAAGSSLDRVYDVRTDARYHATPQLTLRGDVQLSQERQRWPVGGGYNGFIDNHGAQALGEATYLGFGGILRGRLFGQYSDYQFRQSQQSVPIAGSADSLEQREHLALALVSYTRAAGAHTIDAGAQFSLRSIVAPTKIAGDEASDHVTEVFARDAWTRGPALVTLGARSTSSSLWGNALAPSLGGAWQINNAWRGRASVARGFRAPSFKEIRYTFTNPIASYVIIGNPALQPESSWSTDAGVTFAPRSSVAFEFDAYRNRVSNLIDTRLTGLNSDGYQVYQNLNVANASMEGAEFTARVSDGSTEFSAGYNYLRARDLATHKRLDGRSTHTARVQVSRRWSVLDSLASDVTLHYTGSAPVGTAEQGALLSLDAQLRYRVTQRLELSAGVNNVFDQRPALWTPASQRQIYMGVRARAGATN